MIKEIEFPLPMGYCPKYVLDLDITPIIIEIYIHAGEDEKFKFPFEYCSDVTYGPNVKTLAVKLYSEGMMSNDRIVAFLNAVGNGELGRSYRSICHFCKKFSNQAQKRFAHMEEKLRN